ncbi:disulfide bond formation protein B [Caulobacter henricii]|uniref:Disulfide bond formation protein DsbB n=1 Tax=Caulobacter henricii TaxID=69395 RepID=A0A0P0P0C5_9CAUL|nr:disulfide bond formation protein B [Caulobacter henricii]ALL13761.1 disulfide bond formation protein DsbB [Caulobacter henricii]
MTSDLNDPKATAVGLAPAEAPVLEPVRGPLPAEAVAPVRATIIAKALDAWPLVALVASASLLATAHAFETFGKLYPCTLCLKQREVLWVAGTVALVALAARYSPWAAKLRQPFDLLLAAVFLYAAGLAAFHAGVEWKWWPGPTTCSGGTVAAAGDLVAMLKGDKIKPPACDKAAWVFLGLSMAGWNALISLGLSGASLAAGLRKSKATS